MRDLGHMERQVGLVLVLKDMNFFHLRIQRGAGGGVVDLVTWRQLKTVYSWSHFHCSAC